MQVVDMYVGAPGDYLSCDGGANARCINESRPYCLTLAARHVHGLTYRQEVGASMQRLLTTAVRWHCTAAAGTSGGIR